MPRLVSIALLALSVVWCATAAGQEFEPEAAEEQLVAEPPVSSATAEGHYQSAVRLFGEGRYGEALEAFDAAIALSPESIFYCNRAIVLIKLQEAEAALASLEACQRSHAGGPAELAEIDAQRAAVAVLVSHIRPGVLASVSAINAPRVNIDEPRGWTRTETGILLLGFGGAAFASAATLDFLSRDLRTELDARSRALITPGNDYARRQAEYDEARESYVRRQRVWIALTATGAVFTLTGATFVISRLLASEDSSEIEVGILGAGTGFVLTYRW